MGLDPITPGSRPEPKADAQPLCHPGAPIFVFFLKDFIYLFDRDTDSQREREHKQGEWRGRSRLIAEEPDVGLDLITPGSRPELKAEA